jgi:hypothetical protein
MKRQTYEIHVIIRTGMGTGGSFPGGKVAGGWSWPLTSMPRSRKVELDLHSPMWLHGIVLN